MEKESPNYVIHDYMFGVALSAICSNYILHMADLENEAEKCSKCSLSQFLCRCFLVKIYVSFRFSKKFSMRERNSSKQVNILILKLIPFIPQNMFQSLCISSSVA